ncbi:MULTISPECIES: LysR family transcriptional regulator [Methylomonas]|uniref:LysR family transcriptional regulator n=2 Tax=Methylomonas TaxID=416 RepID=A0A140E6C3_9GAMM|nr:MULTISPECIES: LysR family transcriptional regulator [Methylomonas]AMK78947.1 LysR family transcriptional regulator [Methylomonas denitrificans]OAI01464.1 LysR family transcriptional regulator [Methylomonas methanica]TCV76877.1 LysR family transcriptional regulator [Methylomonas methanica]
MDKFNNMRVFCRIVELGTFSAVAKELKLSTMMISKYIAQLEASLGVVLLHRTTRSLSLTSAGEAYYNRSKQLLEDLADLEASTAQLGERVKGTIKISAPIDFGGMYMVPAIERYLKRYPEVKILMSLDNKPPNLRVGSFDISLLVTDTLDPGVVARKIAETELCTYASPDYLTEKGCPQTIDELSNHQCLHYVDTPHGEFWLFNVDGELKKIKSDWVLASNNGRALCEAAALGMGIVQAPRLSVAPYLQSGELVEILRQYRRPALAIYATYLQRRFYPAKLTTFIDFLLEYFER